MVSGTDPISLKDIIYKNNGGSFFDRISDLGMYLFITLMSAAGFVGGLLIRLLQMLGGLFVKLGKVLGRFFRHHAEFIAQPFIRYAKAFRMGGKEISHAAAENGVRGGIKAGLRVFGRILFGKRGLAVTICNYALPVVSCIFLFNIIGYANSMTYALRCSPLRRRSFSSVSITWTATPRSLHSTPRMR